MEHFPFVIDTELPKSARLPAPGRITSCQPPLTWRIAAFRQHSLVQGTPEQSGAGVSAVI